MAMVQFNAHGFLYRSATEIIEQAYNTTMQALELKLRERYDARKILEEEVKAGRVDPEERDEEGYIVVNLFSIEDYQIDDIRQAINVARSAYVVILYHHWEKTCARWMNCPGNYKPPKAYDWLSKNNLSFDEDGLNRMRLVVNYIKHDDKCKGGLQAQHPEFFSEPELDRMRLNSDFELTSNHLAEMFETVKGSGYRASW